MLDMLGLGKTDRKQLAAVIRGTKGAVSVGEAASILGVSRVAAAKMLARWASKGWLSRVRRGLCFDRLQRHARPEGVGEHAHGLERVGCREVQSPVTRQDAEIAQVVVDAVEEADQPSVEVTPLL